MSIYTLTHIHSYIRTYIQARTYLHKNYSILFQFQIITYLARYFVKVLILRIKMINYHWWNVDSCIADKFSPG